MPIDGCQGCRPLGDTTTAHFYIGFGSLVFVFCTGCWIKGRMEAQEVPLVKDEGEDGAMPPAPAALTPAAAPQLAVFWSSAFSLRVGRLRRAVKSDAGRGGVRPPNKSRGLCRPSPRQAELRLSLFAPSYATAS